MKGRSLHILVSIALVTIACLSGGTASAADPASWTRFTSDSGRFSILMPDTPTLKQVASETPVGMIDEHRFTFKNGHLEFAVEYMDLPGLAVIFGGRGKIYRKSVEAFLKDVGGAKLNNHTFTFDAYQGKEISYETATHVGKARFLLIGNRLYVLHATVAKTHIKDGIIEHYLESFEPIYRDQHKHRG